MSAVSSRSATSAVAAASRCLQRRLLQLHHRVNNIPATSTSTAVIARSSSSGLILGHRPVQFLEHRAFSSGSQDGNEEIGKVISGLTQDRIESDPDVKAYVEANFPSDDNTSNANPDVPNHGINIPDGVLKEFGVTDEELDEMMSSTSKKQSKKKRSVGGDGRPVDSGLGTEEQQRLNIRVLSSFMRSVEGTRQSQALREDHKMIPGVLYGGDPFQKIFSHDHSSRTLLQTPWSELQRELDRYHRHFESRVYDLTVYDGDNTEISTHRVVPRNVQRHPVMGKIYCTNFVRYHPKRPLKIPLKYINIEESPALKRDGFIIPINKYVECFVEDGVPIPDALEVECTGLVLKDVIRMDRVMFPDGVRYTDRTDVERFVVGPVKGGRSAATDEDEDGDGEGGSTNTTEAAA
mmetsp:Transcript_54453/g.132156  ORF Transcript_54453/g.132156 Transcript_54453/m.132156 type:complete len:407 (-) Transcript_54453:166-1386(-)